MHILLQNVPVSQINWRLSKMNFLFLNTLVSIRTPPILKQMMQVITKILSPICAGLILSNGL